MTADISTAGCSIVTVERRLTAVVKTRPTMDKIPEAERSARAKLSAALPSLEVGPLGHELTLWHPPVDGRLEMEPGVLVARTFEPLDDVVPSIVPAGRAAYFLHVGSYEGIPGAWNTLFEWCAKQKLELAGVNWQVYEDPEQPVTSLYALLT